MSCTWLTIKEAADFIKVHYTAMLKYIGTADKPGRLKVSRPSQGTIRICVEDLTEFMEGKE